MSSQAKASEVELLTVRTAGLSTFKLLVAFGQDQYFAPCLRDQGYWEPAETLVLQRMLQSGMSVIDIGAHVGYFSVLMAQCVGSTGRVTAFEPDPAHFRLLCANLLINECDQVEARRLAITDARDQGRLYRSPVNPGDQRLHPVAGRSSVPVRCESLDGQLGQAGIDLVKMDCQGSEPMILDGMSGLIQRNRDRMGLLMEFAPGLLIQSGSSVEMFSRRLRSAGAHAFVVKRSGNAARLLELDSLEAGLQSITERLGRSGRDDSSENLFVVFSQQARRQWLERGS
jgi:FkbM family methyltransferase